MDTVDNKTTVRCPVIGERRRVVRGQDRGFVGVVVSDHFGVLLRAAEKRCEHCGGSGAVPSFVWALREATEAVEPDLFDDGVA